MKLVDVTPEELVYVCENLREEDRKEVYATSWNESPEAIAERLFPVCAGAWVVKTHDDTPIAVGGAYCVWPGVWTLWLIGTSRFNECKFGMTKFAKKVMIPSLVNQGAHRAQCYTLASHVESHAWLEALGARRESTHKGYGKNGETFYCYAWDLT